MVTLSAELIDELLRAGWEDGQAKQFRLSLMQSEWYTLGLRMARIADDGDDDERN